jgi:hypothetical protein
VLTDDGTFIPDGSLSSYEMSRIETDPYGALTNMNLKRENMIVGFFLLTRVLIGKILLQPDIYAGLKMIGIENVKKNLKLLASFL